MILTVIESPFAPTASHTVEDHLRYVRACMKHSFSVGEAPFPSHALFTQPGVLDDTIPEERKLGMEAGFAWGKWASRVAVYMDLGISRGMEEGIKRAHARGCEVRRRTLGKPWSIAMLSDEPVIAPEGVRREARAVTPCCACGELLGAAMRGPFHMSQLVIQQSVSPEPGAYVLGTAENRALYVGRADQDLRAKLLTHFGPPGPHTIPIQQFWFDTAPNPWEAYLLECRWYHQFSPTHNAVHPSRPMVGIVAGCPICGR